MKADTDDFPTAVSAVSDLVLAAFPIKVIFSLQMKLSRKIGVSVLMGLGLACVNLANLKIVLPID